MALQPSYLSNGTTPLLVSTRRNLLEKCLGSIQNNLGAAANGKNNPQRRDTRRTLLIKIDRAKAGI